MMNCEISPLSSMISWRVCPAFYPQGNIAGFPPVDKCDDGGSLQVLPICPNNPRNTYPRNCGPPTCKWFLLSVFSVFNPTKIARIFLCYLFIPVNLHLQSTGIGLIFLTHLTIDMLVFRVKNLRPCYFVGTEQRLFHGLVSRSSPMSPTKTGW